MAPTITKQLSPRIPTNQSGVENFANNQWKRGVSGFVMTKKRTSVCVCVFFFNFSNFY